MQQPSRSIRKISLLFLGGLMVLAVFAMWAGGRQASGFADGGDATAASSRGQSQLASDVGTGGLPLLPQSGGAAAGATGSSAAPSEEAPQPTDPDSPPPTTPAPSSTTQPPPTSEPPDTTTTQPPGNPVTTTQPPGNPVTTTTVPPPPGSPTDTTVYPGEDLQAAVDANPPGTTYTIVAGVHRLQSVVPDTGDVFRGEAGAVLSGAKVLSDFTRDGPYWVATGQTQQGVVDREWGVCIAGYTGCQYPEDVFVDNTMLWQVTSLGSLSSGRWYFDYGADKIYLADDPTGRLVETSVTPQAFSGFAADVVIEGLIIEKYASGNNDGAVRSLNGSGWIIRDNEIRLNHSAAVRVGSHTVVEGNYLHHNGKFGVSAVNAVGLVVEANEIAYNNLAGFDPAWGGGGTKFARTTNLVVRNNHVHHNKGTGLWTDIDNVGTRYESNTVVANQRYGIMHEISYDAVITDNVVRDNGSYGIYVAHSSDVEVFGNTVTNNGDGGIWGYYNPARGAGAHGPYELRGMDVHDNLIEMTSGKTGIASAIEDAELWASWGNRYRSNAYVLGDAHPYFIWDGGTVSVDEWIAAGNDVDGEWP